MTELKKLSLAEITAQNDVERHNKAIRAIAGAIDNINCCLDALKVEADDLTELKASILKAADDPELTLAKAEKLYSKVPHSPNVCFGNSIHKKQREDHW